MAERLCRMRGHTDRVWHVCFSPDGSRLASCSGDKTIRLWVWNTTSVEEEGKEEGEERKKVGMRCYAVLEDAQTRTIRSCDWSRPDGELLAAASFDATTAIWERRISDDGVADEEEWEVVSELEGHENEVKSVAWCPNYGSTAGMGMLATCSRDKSVWIWEQLPGYDFECVDVKNGHTQDVKMVAWHPNGMILASASYDDTIKLWVDDGDGDEWRCAQTLVGHTSTVWALAFNYDGSKMVSVGDDKSLKIWACNTTPSGDLNWSCIQTISGQHRRPIYSVSWSHANGMIATGSGDNSINIFTSGDDDGNFKLFHTIAQAHEFDVNCVVWHPFDPKILVSASDDQCVHIWNIDHSDNL